MVMTSPRLFCALDTDDLDTALALARALTGIVDGVKLGLEFFSAHGPAGVRAVQALGNPARGGLPIFLDMKYHDIPNTVAGAVRAAAMLGVDIITVHAVGGEAMLRAAGDAAAEGAAAAGLLPPSLVAISVLTSLGEDDLGRIGMQGPIPDQVARLAQLAMASGLAGVVSSAREAAMLRRTLGPNALLVVPGLRPHWAAVNDQKRVVTPGEAVRLGADLLVIGRPITAAEDPAEAARRIKAEIAPHSAARMAPR